jgi:hypothetical protein
VQVADAGVADEDLLAADEPVPSFTAGSGGHAEQVAAGGWFGDRDGGEEQALGDRREPPLFLLRRSQGFQ